MDAIRNLLGHLGNNSASWLTDKSSKLSLEARAPHELRGLEVWRSPRGATRFEKVLSVNQLSKPTFTVP
jgi:hypothetical protein